MVLRQHDFPEHQIPGAVLCWLSEALSEGRHSQCTNVHRVVFWYNRASTTEPLSTSTAVENSCVFQNGFWKKGSLQGQVCFLTQSKGFKKRCICGTAPSKGCSWDSYDPPKQDPKPFGKGSLSGSVLDLSSTQTTALLKPSQRLLLKITRKVRGSLQWGDYSS